MKAITVLVLAIIGEWKRVRFQPSIAEKKIALKSSLICRIKYQSSSMRSSARKFFVYAV